MRTIWLDMDGVVADFQHVSGEILGRKVGWGSLDITSEEWKELSKHQHLYANLPVLPGSLDLMEAVREHMDEFEVKFLTAIPRTKTFPFAEEDKRKWIEENFPGIEVEIGPYSKDKWKHSKFLDILIDDRSDNILDWFTKGNGIAIFHNGDHKKTIKLLHEAVKITTPIRLGNPF